MSLEGEGGREGKEGNMKEGGRKGRGWREVGRGEEGGRQGQGGRV